MKTLFPPKSWQTELEDHPFIALRHPWYRVLCDLQDGFSRATVGFFARRGLRNLHLPITTASISSPMGLGSDSQPVSVNLCGVPTYLADSMQFFLEYGCRFGGKGTYYLQPSFRGELPDARHLSQFHHAEAEILGTLDEVIVLVENYLKTVTRALSHEYRSEIMAAAGTLAHVDELLHRPRIPMMEVEEAIRVLGNQPRFVTHNPIGFSVITAAGERELLVNYGPFLWLIHPSHRSVPFYQAFSPRDGRLAMSADLLMGIGETVGAGQRHIGAPEVEEALALHGVEKNPYQWYVQMKERHPLQTSGFGLGTERYLCWLLGHDDVRDLQLVPRFNGVHHIF